MEPEYVASKEILYQKVCYKYLLHQDLVVKTSIEGAAFQIPKYVYLTQDGWLTIKAGYAWDGPSGPTWDTPDFMSGSCIHDALYQAMRQRRLHQEWRAQADKELIRACKRAGMPWWRRRYVLWALRRFAAFAAKPRTDAVYSAVA